MLIQFSGVWLTNDGTGSYPETAITSAQDIQPSMDWEVQTSPVLRGSAKVVFGRGNGLGSLAFKVTRNFGLIHPTNTPQQNIALAEAYILLNNWTLPQFGTVLLYCGPIGSTPIVLQGVNAALKSSPRLVARGLAVETSFTITCATLIQLTNLLSGAGGTLLSGAGNPLVPAP